MLDEIREKQARGHFVETEALFQRELLVVINWQIDQAGNNAHRSNQGQLISDTNAEGWRQHFRQPL